MRAEFEIKNPDEVEAKITIHAPVGELRKLEKQIKEAGLAYSHPMSTFMVTLREVICDAELHFYKHGEDTDGKN